MKKIFFVLKFIIIFLLSSNLFGQVKISMFPLDFDLDQKYYTDLFIKINKDRTKTNYPTYEKDLKLKLEKTVKKHLLKHNIKTSDFIINKEDETSYEYMKGFLDGWGVYQKKMKSLKGKMKYEEKKKLKKSAPKSSNPLTKKFGEKVDDKYILYINAFGKFMRSKKKENKDAPYRKTPSGYLDIEVVLLESQTGEVVTVFLYEIGFWSSSSKDRVTALSNKQFRWAGRKIARKINKAINKHENKRK